MERIDRILTTSASSTDAQLLPPRTASAPSDQVLPEVRHCLRCKGAGYLRRDLPFDHPEFGKPVACVCLEQQRQAKQQRQLRTLSQIETLARFRAATFETFDAGRPGVKEAFLAAMRFAGRPAGWLVLAGQHQQGKTHLAVALAQDCLAQNEPVLILVVADLLDQLRSAFAPTAAETYDEIFSRMKTVKILILDNLPAEQETPWASEKLFQLLDYRYNAMLPTVITTSLTRLDMLEPRLASKFMDTAFVTFIVVGAQEEKRKV